MPAQDIITALEKEQPLDIETIKAWFDVNKPPNELKKIIFFTAAENGHLNVVQYLLTLPGVDPTAQNHYAILWAARKGHLSVANSIGSMPIYNPFDANISAIDKTSRLNFLKGLNLDQAISSHLAKANHNFGLNYRNGVNAN